MRNEQFGLRLLPNYFKKIGIGILVLTILFFLLWAYKILTMDKLHVLTISKTGIIVSLMILSWTKIKTEDELTTQLRLIAFALAFSGGGITIIAGSFLESFGYNYITVDLFKNSAFVIISMYIMYFTTFRHLLKRR
ncbi:MAG: hypothetical protein PHI32_06405 [Dysgonamonadaceae bacterium]|nr:hypothetical protein [Dysgonamonadaceae bacterium]MDD4728990.1 hypothetical protein [Dysgonamonadaceae bacterium]